MCARGWERLRRRWWWRLCVRVRGGCSGGVSLDNCCYAGRPWPRRCLRHRRGAAGERGRRGCGRGRRGPGCRQALGRGAGAEGGRPLHGRAGAGGFRSVGRGRGAAQGHGGRGRTALDGGCRRWWHGRGEGTCGSQGTDRSGRGRRGGRGGLALHGTGGDRRARQRGGWWVGRCPGPGRRLAQGLRRWRGRTIRRGRPRGYGRRSLYGLNGCTEEAARRGCACRASYAPQGASRPGAGRREVRREGAAAGGWRWWRAVRGRAAAHWSRVRASGSGSSRVRPSRAGLPGSTVWLNWWAGPGDSPAQGLPS